MRLVNDFYHIEAYKEYENGAKALLKLNSEHKIYKAHFPGHPITPGVCIIKIFTELIEERIGQSLLLCQARNIKFLNRLTPNDTPLVSVSFSYQIEIEEATKYTVKGEISDDKQIFAKLSIIYE